MGLRIGTKQFSLGAEVPGYQPDFSKPKFSVGEPTDYTPQFDTVTPDQSPLPREASKSSMAQEFWGSLKGSSFGENPRALADTIDILGILSDPEKGQLPAGVLPPGVTLKEPPKITGPSMAGQMLGTPRERAKQVSDWIRNNASLDPYQRSVPSITDIGLSTDPSVMLSRAGQYIAGAAGQTVGSSLPSVAVGAGVSALTDSPAGFVVGAWTPSFVQNTSDLWQQLNNDKGIQARLAKGELTDRNLAQISASVGIVLGAMDAYGLDKALGVEGRKFRGNLIKRAIKAGLEGGTYEGITEAAQQLVEETATAMAGSDQTISQHMISVLDAGIQGFIGGVGLGATTPGKRADVKAPADHAVDQDKTTAQPEAPAGAEVPPPSAAVGQTTPGGTSAQPPAPPVKPSRAATPPTSQVGVVAAGQVEPSVAAAISPTQSVSTPPVPAALPPAGGVVASPDQTTSPVLSEPDFNTEPPPEQGVPDDMAALAQTRDILQELLKQTKQANQTPIVPPNEDVTAAIQAQQPAPATPSAPQVPMPEPAGTPEAAARRALPQPVPSPAVEAPSATPQPAASLEAAPTVAPEPAPTPPAPIAAFGTQEPQPAPPAAAPTFQLGEGTPPPEIARLATPEPPPAQMAPLARQFAGVLRQELYNDPISEHPYFGEAVDRVAARAMAGRPKGTAPAAAIHAALPQAVQAVRQGLATIEATQAEKAATQTTQALTRAKDIAHERRVAGAPQERPRGPQKKAEEVAGEHHRSTMRAVQREMAKPEGERDQNLMEYARLAEERKKISKRGEAARIQRDAIAKAMEAAQKRRVERLARQEQEAAPPKPSSLPTPQPETIMSAAPAGEEVKPGLPAVQTPESAAQADQYQKAKERSAKLLVPLRTGLRTVSVPDFNRVRSMKELDTKGTKLMQDVVQAATDALKSIGETLGKRISRNNTPEENLVIFARELLAGKKHPGMGAAEFVSAKALMEAGAMEDFYNLVTNEQMAGTVGSIEQQVAARTSAETFDEGSGQLLSAPPTPVAPTGQIHRFEGKQGRSVDVEVKRRSTVGALLNEARLAVKMNSFFNQDAFAGMILRMHIKQLRKLVSDVPVIFATPQDIAAMSASMNAPTGRAFYHAPTDTQRAAGVTPTIYIDVEAWVAGGDANRAHVLLHEATHAATARAIDVNLRGSKEIFSTMRGTLERWLKDNGHWDSIPSLHYAFINAHEFLAEAFSNPNFQQLLAEVPFPEHLAPFVEARIAGRPRPTWWQAFVKAVSNALGMFSFAPRTQSYMDAVVRAYPNALQSSEEQRRAAIASRFRSQNAKAVPTSAFDTAHFIGSVQQSLEAVKGKAGMRPWSQRSRQIWSNLATTEELKRRSVELFGGENNPFQRWADLYLSRRALRNTYRELGDNLTQKLAEYDQKDRAAASEMTDIAFEATQAQVDPSSPLGSASNKHISKKGLLDTWRRAAHQRLAARWMALPPEAKALFKELSNHYQSMENLRVEKLVRNIIRQAVQKYDLQLPAGVTEKDAINWVLDGSIDRNVDEQTPYDQALHKALGSTAETLKGTQAMRQIKGTYVPLLRYGKYFFTATHKVAVPQGAVLDPTVEQGNVLIFANRKDVENYQNNTDEQIQSVVSRWLDPATGKRVNSKDVNAKQFIYVTVQNRVMEMGDSLRDLAKRRDPYLNGAFDKVSEPALINSIMTGNSQILPRQINALINNVKQSTVGSVTVGQEANINAITAAYIRQLSGNRAAHRRLKRANVAGFSRDLIKNTLTANHVMSGHLTNLDVAPQMADAEEEVNKYINDQRNVSTSPMPASTLWRQTMVRELRKRIEAMNQYNEEQFGTRLTNSWLNITFMRHLFTPSFTITNLTQPISTTYPVLASKFGDGATIRAMASAYRDLGAASTVWGGIKETGREARKIFGPAHRVFDFHADAKARSASLPDGALFGRFMDRVDELGYGAQSGIEAADIHEIGRSKTENAIGRATRVARALSEAAEAVNRYTTGLAALRLAKRRGMTDEQAIEFAVTTVEQTQGGYAAENNPAFMSHWILRVPLQFKKYALLYGQLYYGALARALNVHADKQTRAEARRQLIRLSATTMALAGVGGLPFIEIARVIILMAAALPGEQDDWDTWENGLQQWFADTLKWATGSQDVSNKSAEVLFHGASRMLGFDTSSRLGNDSLLLFGSPKSMDEQGVKSWLWDLATGAPGGVAADLVKFMNNPSPKYLPMPKFMIDAWKAVDLYTQGTVSSSGRQLAPPISGLQAIWQLLGFRPASQAEQWEAGGGAAQAKADKRASSDRTSLMGEWATAKGGNRQQIWSSKIREWNASHPDKKQKIEMGDLRRSLARRKQLGEVQ